MDTIATRAALVAALAFGLGLVAAPAADAAEETASAHTHFVIEMGPLRLNEPPRPPDAPDGVNWWYYDVTLKETAGRSGILLTGWTKCYTTPDDVGCEPVRANFERLYGADRVPAGGALGLKRPAWVWARKTGGTYKVEATYWGVDDEGNALEAHYGFTFKSD